MRYKQLGDSNLKVSQITVGTWAIGGQGWGEVDKKSSIEAIREMLDNGVNIIDTAPVYGLGYAEEVVAEAIQGYKREDIVISTKCGLKWGEEFAPAYVKKDMTREEVIRGCEDSLRRLKTDYIDILFIHWPDNVTPIEESMEAMEELKKQGKIRYIGLSNFTKEDTRKANEITKITTIQPQFSMVSQNSRPEMEDAKQQGIGTMTYGSLGAGILTGVYRSLPNFDPNDTRLHFYDFFKEPRFSKIMKLLEKMDVISKERGVPLAQIAINWNTQNPLVDTALLGVRNAKEAKENCAALDWMLTTEEIDFLNKAIEKTL